MLEREFIDAALAVAPEDDGSRHLNLSYAHNWNHSGVPEWVWRAITACYHSRRLDAVCAGANRHESFARWLCVPANWEKVRRLCSLHYRAVRRAELRERIARLQHEIMTDAAQLERFNGNAVQ